MTFLELAPLFGPLLGAAGGTYFGLKGALNGMKETTKRIEIAVNEVRDTVRIVAHDLEKQHGNG